MGIENLILIIAGFLSLVLQGVFAVILGLFNKNSRVERESTSQWRTSLKESLEDTKQKLKDGLDSVRKDIYELRKEQETSADRVHEIDKELAIYKENTMTYRDCIVWRNSCKATPSIKNNNNE